MEQVQPRLWSRAVMCSMADLASGFALPLNVGVGCNLGNEYKKHDRQAKSDQPSQVAPHLCPVNHFAF